MQMNIALRNSWFSTNNVTYITTMKSMLVDVDTYYIKTKQKTAIKIPMFILANKFLFQNPKFNTVSQAHLLSTHLRPASHYLRK
jgi:hypothetical protein